MTNFLITEGFIEENIEDFTNRYQGFGKEVYKYIKQELPNIYSRLKYYRNTITQTEDSYAEFIDNINNLAIQLDPVSEVIVIWDETKHIEIGTWSNNQYKETINYIKNILLTKNVS